MERIRLETKNLERNESNTFNALALQNDAPYLNAFINEALRLHPPVPGGFQRQTPPEGITVTSTEDSGKAIYIPGGINIWMPLWTMSRCTFLIFISHGTRLTPIQAERCYTDPLEFAPERWLPEESEYTSETSPKVLRKDAFLAFSTGPMACVGKGLALQEMRMVIAVLLDRFEPSLAKGEDGKKLLEESKDWFTIGIGALEVVFEERKKE